MLSKGNFNISNFQHGVFKFSVGQNVKAILWFKFQESTNSIIISKPIHFNLVGFLLSRYVYLLCDFITTVTLGYSLHYSIVCIRKL